MQYDTPFVLKVRLHIAQNMHRQDYQIEDICLSLEISRSQLYRKLKKQAGKTYSQMLNEIRTQKACILLENMDLNIAEIAYASGFKDPSYFARVFKKIIGTTPGRYKKHTRASLPSDSLY